MNELIPISRPVLSDKAREYVLDCIDTAWISSAGSYITTFEQLNADFYGVAYGAAVSNGTTALHLALTALDIGPGDEVIAPSLTFAATVNTVMHAGATPVLADIEEDSWTIDIDRCDSLISAKTKAIIPVHLYGQPCNMDKISAFAQKHSLYIIEDCAEAHGAAYRGQKVGSFGDISCFSFYANKIITTGEGGICLTGDAALAERMQRLRDHGMQRSKKYQHDEIGFNYRMTNMQAAIGCSQMEEIDVLLRIREQISARYNSHLSDFPLIQIQNSFDDRNKVCWMYTILLDEEKLTITVEDLQKQLKAEYIDSRPFFVPMHFMQPYKNLRNNKPVIAEKIYKTGICLPTSVDMQEETIDYICTNLIKILDDHKK